MEQIYLDNNYAYVDRPGVFSIIFNFWFSIFFSFPPPKKPDFVNLTSPLKINWKIMNFFFYQIYIKISPNCIMTQFGNMLLFNLDFNGFMEFASLINLQIQPK